MQVDHADDAQIAALFEQLQREQGRLDILVNNTIAIPDEIPQLGGFWEKRCTAGLKEAGLKDRHFPTVVILPAMLDWLAVLGRCLSYCFCSSINFMAVFKSSLLTIQRTPSATRTPYAKVACRLLNMSLPKAKKLKMTGRTVAK